MPKKQPRNSYYFFMIDFRDEQRKKGITYENLTEVQKAADPQWRSATPAVRNKYEQMAKREKEKMKIPEKKYTANGMTFAEVEQQRKLAQEIEEAEIKEIKNFVKLKGINHMIFEEDIYLIDVNTYCPAGNHFLMAESTVLRFNLLEGIKDYYHEMINPGRIPIGYASDVKLGATELGLDMPDEDTKRTDFLNVLANIMDYLKQSCKESNRIPPLYTLPEKVEQVQDFISQLCFSAGEDEAQLRVYKLENLFFYLVNEIKSRPDEGYPKLSLAVAQLKKDAFRYTPGLGCEHHEESDKAIECSKSRVKRWAYTILDKCCPVAGIEAIPGKHVPLGVDIEGVLTYKEQRKGTVGQLAASSMPSSCNTSVLNESYDTSSSAVWEKPKTQPKRTHEPLRMPKTDYSQTIRPAPELTEANFPKLVAGQGRGRGMSKSFNKLSVDK